MNMDEQLGKFETLLEELKTIEDELAQDQNHRSEAYRTRMREYARLNELRDLYERYQKIEQEKQDLQEFIQEESDSEMLSVAQKEHEELEIKAEDVLKILRIRSIIPDPLDDKNVIAEIRAGTGGEEAALFAEDIFRMYSKYAESKSWKIDILQSSQSPLGGFREVIFSVSGNSVFGTLKYERGVHRVQRIPETESSGRIHTSAITVAILPEADETDIEIRNEDIRIDVFRSSGPGGQSVNTTDSAVRITHLPSSLVVTCQDEKSQHKNKAKALRVLKARLYELEENNRRTEEASARKKQIGSGDRSERIRTYNFPQNRISDHRINLTLYRLDAVMEGELSLVVDPLLLAQPE